MIFKREKVKFTYKDGFTTVTFKNVSEIAYHAETTAVNHIVGSEQAANINYIGIEDCTNGRTI